VQEFSVAPGEIAGLSVDAFSSSPGRGDDADYVQLFPAVDMGGLAFIAGVGQERLEAVSGQSLVYCGLKLRIVELRPPVNNR